MMPLLAAILNAFALVKAYFTLNFSQIRRNDTAALGNLATVAFAIVGVILAAVIGLRILASLAPTYATSVADISEVFNTTDWYDPTANDISPIFAMVSALAGLLGFVGLVFVSVGLYKKYSN